MDERIYFKTNLAEKMKKTAVGKSMAVFLKINVYSKTPRNLGKCGVDFAYLT
jgi:hypothetical protein